MNLLIVESPTKAKTISKFLPAGYKVESSFGHIRDLPKKSLGVDVDNNFKPEYEIPAKSKKRATELKRLAKNAKEIYYATDEDREGEAIAWHLAKIFKANADKTKRITFHEITKNAIIEAIKKPRSIDMNIVDAQQARRILDRLVGYKLSPLLWKKVAKGLSAGRVQSVLVRLLVEKEREIQKFEKKEYWQIEADFLADNKKEIKTKLFAKDGKTLKKLDIKNKNQADDIEKLTKSSKFKIVDKETKKTKRNAPTPYTTSTLQQDANRRLGFSAKQTMMLAQKLYEGAEIGGESTGLITYMRTDSLNLSNSFIAETKQYIIKELGDKYYLKKIYKTKSKGAQEAHEAIRPTSAMRHPSQLKNSLEPRQLKLYTLIWQRAVASQMSPAEMESARLDISDDKNKLTYRATGQIIKFPGFMKIFPAGAKEEILPEVEIGNKTDLIKFNAEQKFTQPPARYNDAKIVKTMEEMGIGRPSTYAPTIATVLARNYAIRTEKKKLKPTDIAFIVSDLLTEHFSQIVDYNFTAEMEENLDNIAEGKKDWQKTIADFYKPFIKNLMEKDKNLNKKEITEESTDEKCEKCGSAMVIKVGRFGKFLACSNYPECKNTKNINSDGDIEEKKEPVTLDEKCPQCGANLILRQGRYGEFKGCSNYPKCKYIKSETPQGPDIDCPKCKQGKVVTKRSRRGLFYGCDRYPKCDYAFWGKPTEKKCPDCGFVMAEDKNGKIKCTNKECKQ